MANENLGPVQLETADLKTLEEIATQVGACKQASEKSGKAAHVLTVFLKMVDERLSGFVKDLRDRMRTAAKAI